MGTVQAQRVIEVAINPIRLARTVNERLLCYHLTGFPITDEKPAQQAEVVRLHACAKCCRGSGRRWSMTRSASRSMNARPCVSRGAHLPQRRDHAPRVLVRLHSVPVQVLVLGGVPEVRAGGAGGRPGVVGGQIVPPAGGLRCIHRLAAMRP